MHISNRQQFEKRALKIIAFVLLAVLLLEGMSKVLMPRSNSGSGGMPQAGCGRFVKFLDLAFVERYLCYN